MLPEPNNNLLSLSIYARYVCVTYVTLLVYMQQFDIPYCKYSYNLISL